MILINFFVVIFFGSLGLGLCYALYKLILFQLILVRLYV